MDGQTIAVVLIVAAAVLYLARATWRTWGGAKGGCGGGCGCKTAPPAGGERPTFIPAEQVGLRRRRDASPGI
jgi:hypothetical protein